MEEKGLVHIYFGNGKGKTTAAVGLAVRAAGSGGKVLFYQFLKDGSSGEISVLKMIDGIEVVDGYRDIKFSGLMTDSEILKAKKYYRNEFKKISEKVSEQDYDLLVLDEVFHAVNKEYVLADKLIEFLKNRPFGLEVVLTGRDFDERFYDLADYISEVLKIKHPFDKGLAARKMIEK